ncbi:hypothetical protein JTE90_006600 [Oedothorax gibbosus]|uniref:BOD1/SHG1 domain-containing protein n=1 Tax=Oedothorax gibbosus TaxID=931172 RepID=A0AAV6U467_9ARAC|nr:hypothetical protein JTE90_006600 [Oedothorax gibbosus]
MDSHLVPGDPILVENIVSYLKAMGVFDEFRHECLADVDTKSSYQNLSQRVDGYTSKFLAAEAWNPDLNKNEMRNKLRKHIDESGMLAGGTDHVVEQVINPKIPQTMFPKIIEVVHQYLAKEKEKLHKKEIVNQEKIATETAPKPKTTVLDPIAEILSFTYAKPKPTPAQNAQAKNSEASKVDKKKEEALHQAKISDSKADKKKEDTLRPTKPPITATKLKKEVPDQTLATEAVPNIEKKEDIAISVKVEPVETKELLSVSSTLQANSADEGKEPEKVVKSLKAEELETTGFETPKKVEKDDIKHEKKKVENLKLQIPESAQSDDSNETKSSPSVKSNNSGKIKPESSKHNRNKPLGLGVQRTSSKVEETSKSIVKESSSSSSEKVSSDQDNKPSVKLPSNQSKDRSSLKNTISAKMVKCEKAGDSSKSKNTPSKLSDKHSSSKLKKVDSPLKLKHSSEKHEKTKSSKDSKTLSESPSIKPSSSSYDSSQGSDPDRSSSSSKEKLKHFSKHHRKDSSSTDTSSKSSSDKKQPQSDTESGTLKSDKRPKSSKHSSTDEKKKFTVEESAKIAARSDSIGSMSSTSDSQTSLKETSSISDSQTSMKESSASGETSDSSSRKSSKKKKSSRSSKEPCSDSKDLKPPSPPSPSSGLVNSSSAELSSQDETQSSQESRESEDESSEGGSSGSEDDNSDESAAEEMTLKTKELFASEELNPFLNSSSSEEFEGFNSSPEKGAKPAASDVSSVHTSDLSSFEDELSDVEAEDAQSKEGKKRLTLKEAEKILKAKAEKKLLEAIKTTPPKASEDVKEMKSSPQGSETPTSLPCKVDVSPTPEPKRESRRERKLNPKYASSEYKSIFDSKRTTFITKQNNQTETKSPAEASPVKNAALTRRKSSANDKSPLKVADLPLEESSKSSSSSVVLEYSSEDISTFGMANSEIKTNSHIETDPPNRIALKIKLSATKNRTNKNTSQGTKRKLDLEEDKSSAKRTCLRNSVSSDSTENENKTLNNKNPSGVLSVNRVTDKEVFNKQQLNSNGDILSKMERVKRNSISKSNHVHEKQNRD